MSRLYPAFSLPKRLPRSKVGTNPFEAKQNGKAISSGGMTSRKDKFSHKNGMFVRTVLMNT